MRMSLAEAKGLLIELVRGAEAGDEGILARHDRAAVRLVPVTPALTGAGRGVVLVAARWPGGAEARAGPSAARSQDFLYDKDGLPR